MVGMKTDNDAGKNFILIAATQGAFLTPFS
jgi:hypothetical protein